MFVALVCAVKSERVFDLRVVFDKQRRSVSAPNSQTISFLLLICS
jgi:hypothetical protein